MRIGKLAFSPLTMLGGVLIFFGLGLSVFALQQQQNQQSRADGPYGDGLRGTYYPNPDFTGSPNKTWVDSVIDFTWSESDIRKTNGLMQKITGKSPGGASGGDSFSVRWEGYFVPQYTGTYTLRIRSDDAASLWINNNQLINKTGACLCNETRSIFLVGGKPAPIKIEFTNVSGPAEIHFYWSLPGNGPPAFGERIIPQMRFYSSASRLPANGCGQGPSGSYCSTCWNEFINGSDLLTAICDPSTQRTTISVSKCSGHDISNNNGRLQCGDCTGSLGSSPGSCSPASPGQSNPNSGGGNTPGLTSGNDSQYVGQSCTNSNGVAGTCQTVNPKTCSGVYDPAPRCPGSRNIQCCTPQVSSGGGGTSSGGSAGALGGACVNGWSGTCMNHNNPSSCNGSWIEGKSPWPCPHSGSNVWCCVPPGQGPAPVVDAIAPTAPTNLAVTVVSATQNTLSWTGSTDTVGVTGYKIFRNGTQITTATTTTYEDTNLTPNTTYTYYVIASDAAGNNSSKSNEVTKQTASLDTTFLLNLMIHGIGSGEFDVPHSQWAGEDPIASLQVRNVKVEVYEITNQGYGKKLAEGTGEVKYANGAYTSVEPIDVGTKLSAESKNYGINIVSGSALKIAPFTIIGGQKNMITMNLDNGDADRNGVMNILDYHLIYRCVKDKEGGKVPAASQCSNGDKLNSDIDDDGQVTWYDLVLLQKQFAYLSL